MKKIFTLICWIGILTVTGLGLHAQVNPKPVTKRKPVGSTSTQKAAPAPTTPVVNTTSTPVTTTTTTNPSTTGNSASRPKTVPAANKGNASIVFHFMGDDPCTTFFQETMHLKKAMEGYKKIILLKHNETASWLDLSEADEKMADIKDLPTQANVIKYIKQLASEGYVIDIWFICHGTTDAFMVSNGSFNGTPDRFTDAEVRSELGPDKTGYTAMPIRMVWSTACYGLTMNGAWTEIGAKVVGGSRYVNFYPTQFGKFADEWNKGNVSYSNAYDASDNATTRTVVQTYVGYVHAPSCNKDWGNCPFGKTVLGDNPCAKDYFTTKWIDKSEWQSNMEGKDNMNYSSHKVIRGDGTMTKNKSVSW